METNPCFKTFLPLLLLGFLIRTTHTNNVSIPEELRHPRVSGRIVKLYSGIKPEPILCSGEGFQEDPVDCAVFYRCVKGSNNKFTVFRYQCGPGTVYDPDTEICNHPKSTKRINCGGTGSHSLSSRESANENEIDGSRQEIPSPITTKQVVYTEPATKNASSTQSTQKFWSPAEYKSTPTASSTYTWITTAKEHLRATRSPIPRQPNVQSGEPCTSDGFMGDSENCRKFYRCVGNGRGGYIRYEFSCSELTIWDDDAQACNHAWAVKKRRCGRGGSEDEDRNNESPSTTEDNEVNSKQTIQSQLQISYGSKVNQIQTQISKGSVSQNQTQINYGQRIKEKPRSNGKQNQTQISHGSAVSQTQTQVSHGSKGSQTQLQIDHSKESSQSQTQIHETDTDQTSDSQHDEDIQRPNNEKPINGNENNECTESGFMGDSKDCKKFYRCVDNGRGGYIKYEFSCGEGTVWDSNAGACNHAWAVKDCKNKNPSETMEQDSKTTTTTSKSTTVETVPEEDEDVGYADQNQQPSQTSTVSQNKPSTTTETSKTTQANEHDDALSSTIASGENVCTSSGFMGDSGDCKIFYRCVDNGNGGYNRYEFSCGEGTVWDPKLEACNHAWAVEKCGKGAPDKNTPDTTTSASNVQHDDENHSEHPIESNNNVDKTTESTTTSMTSTTISTSPTPSSPNNNICTATGFMGDKNDCKMFYRCVDDGKGGYTSYEFSCGEGTVWDQSIESCNHPSKDNQCKASESATQESLNDGTTLSSSNSQTSASDPDGNSQGSTEPTSSEEPFVGLSSVKPTNDEDSCSRDGFFGDTKNCKKFYRCVENQHGGFTKYDFTCGEGTMWDPEIEACNHESSAKMGCRTPVAEESTQQEAVPENNENVESSTSPLSTSTTTEKVQDQSPSNDKCESEGFFANSVNCKKFYRCVDNGKGGYTKYDFTCGDGTIWDQQSQTCNHESSQSKCAETSETNAPENAESEAGTTTQSAVSSDSTTSATKQPNTGNNDQSNSNDQCTSEGFYANSKDCKKFYRCVSNDKGGYTKYDFTCGEGTIWVQEIQACDHDDGMSNCTSKGIVSTTSSSQNGQNEQPTTKASSTTSESTPVSENNEMPTDCSNNSTTSTHSNECKSEGFHPNNNDCRKFYRCVDNGQDGYTKYDFTCGEGTAWDAKIQACNHENEVKNCNGPQEENQSELKPTDENSSQTTEASSITKTSTTESSGENNQPTGNDKCEKEGFYGDNNDCQKFYRCVDNGNGGLTKYDFTCGDGTIWDQDIQTCNHPGDVQNPSCSKNTTSSATTTESSSGTSSTSSETSSTSSTLSSSSTASTEGQGSSDCSQSSTQKPQQNKQVNCTKAGFYADPDDCKKFYRCVDWDNNGQRFSVYHFDCGEGTIWDPELETCNHEDSVYPPRDCSGTQNQDQNTGDSTTQSSTTESPTQESTTQSSTTESSTQESTTTEESTTQSSTTESSTTQETTSEQTTTEQSTTQKSTTTEKSTTQQSSTEQSTTQQSSTTEQSTTEKSTTTEQSTTQQSSTTEQTTEQTSTTEQSTAESSTTEQSSTIEQSTTEQSSTTQSTTATEESTTQQSTTQQDTTTTEQSSTQETTDSSTEQSSTTEESTTQESSTTEQATETTDSSTTEQSSSSTTEQSSDGTTEGNQESTTGGSSSGSKDCPDTEDDQYLYVCPTSFRRHPRYCNMFYQCTEDNDSHDLDIAVFKCPNNTIYDESKTQCVEEDKADKKCDGEKAERRRVKRLGVNYKEPIVASKDSLICPSTGHFPFEKSECSPAFLKCDRTKYGKLRGYVNQCPDGYVYWSISRRCEPQFKVKDCKMTSNDWRGRWEIPIEKNNVAT